MLFYQHLIHLRAQSPALVEGDYRSIKLDNDQIYAYVRETEQQRFMVVLNFAKTAQTVSVKGRIGKWVAGTHATYGDGRRAEVGELALKAYEGRVYEILRGEA